MDVGKQGFVITDRIKSAWRKHSKNTIACPGSMGFHLSHDVVKVISGQGSVFFLLFIGHKKERMMLDNGPSIAAVTVQRSSYFNVSNGKQKHHLPFGKSFVD